MLGRRGSRNTAKRRAKQQRMSGASGTGTRRTPPNSKKIIAPGFKSRRLSPAEIRLNRRGARRGKKHDMEIAQAAGFKNMNQMQAAMQRMNPEQRMQFERKNAKRFAEIGARNQAEFNKRNAKLLERVRRQQRRRMGQQNPMMPTAGVSQGSNATGRTPMPGPAPDSERMRRMQQLMREQQKRFNDARRRPTDTRRRRPTEAERMAANDARRRRTRNTRTPDIDDLIAAAKRRSGRTGSGTLEARTNAAKQMNRIQRQMRGLPPSGRPVGQPTGRRRRPIRGRRR